MGLTGGLASSGFPRGRFGVVRFLESAAGGRDTTAEATVDLGDGQPIVAI